jgi:hypothetical protein
MTHVTALALVVAVKVWVPLTGREVICGETVRVVGVKLPADSTGPLPKQPTRKSVEASGKRQANGRRSEDDSGHIEPPAVREG